MTAQRTIEILAAASILRSLQTTPFVSGRLTCLAEGIETAVLTNDMERLARIRSAIQVQREKMTGLKDRHVRSALFGVHTLLVIK